MTSAPAPHVHLDHQQVLHDDRLGEVERHVGPRRPQFQPPRDQPLPGPLDRPSLLVDPDHLFGPCPRACRTGHQVSGQYRQLTERPRRERGSHSLPELISGQPAVPQGHAQYVHHLVPVPVRGPDLGRPPSHRKSADISFALQDRAGSTVAPSPALVRPAGCGHTARTGTLTPIQVRGPPAPRAHSSAEEHSPYKREAGGSNPPAPTKFLQLDYLFETLIGSPVTTPGNHRCTLPDGRRVPRSNGRLPSTTRARRADGGHHWH